MGRVIGIFGGTFNPVHRGHIALAEFIKDNCGLDEVWMMVSPLNPLKTKSCDEIVCDEKRLEMLRIATRDKTEIKVSDVELRLPRPSYTINTLKYLDSVYGDCEFALIIGSDNLIIFDKWKDHEAIAEKYRIIVYPRNGVDVGRYMGGFRRIEIVKGDEVDVSSTEIRDRVRNGESIKGLVDIGVERFIKSEGLYKVRRVK